MAPEYSFWDPYPEAQPPEKSRPSFQAQTAWQSWETRTDLASLAFLGWLSQYIGWTVSLLFHAGAALVLGYALFLPALGSHSDSFTTHLSSELDTGDLGGPLGDSQSGGSPLELAAFVNEASQTDPQPLQPTPVTVPNTSVGLKPAELNSMAGLGTGVGNGKGAGNGGQVEFFGTRGLGNSVVFVVDMSGSMLADKRFPTAQRELIQSINSLKSQQRFYVIFYNMKEFPIFSPNPPRRMIAATSSLKNQARTWINSIHPGGGTEPQVALEQALKLRPDMIYFLTDGEIPSETREMLNTSNRQKITIHTIAFQNEHGQEILKDIAHDHHGTFRFVPK